MRLSALSSCRARPPGADWGVATALKPGPASVLKALRVSFTGGSLGPDRVQDRRTRSPRSWVPRFSLTGCSPDTLAERTRSHCGPAVPAAVPHPPAVPAMTTRATIQDAVTTNLATIRICLPSSAFSLLRPWPGPDRLREPARRTRALLRYPSIPRPTDAPRHGAASLLRVHHVLEDGDSGRGDVARRPLHRFVQLQRLGPFTSSGRIVPLKNDDDVVRVGGAASGPSARLRARSRPTAPARHREVHRRRHHHAR